MESLIVAAQRAQVASLVRALIPVALASCVSTPTGPDVVQHTDGHVATPDTGASDATDVAATDAWSADADDPDAGTDATTSGDSGVASCTLIPSGPITVAADGEVIEHRLVTSTSGDAIRVAGHANVVIRSCEIHHCGGAGISFTNAPGIQITDVVIVDTCAPAAGALPSEQDSIAGESSSGVVISRVRVTRGSSGVYLNQCAGAQVRFVEGHDIRGPFPRGQLVQFNHCDGALLEDFSCENPPATSWPEDVVSVYTSNNVTVRRGLVDGNNSPSGDGVMFEHSNMGRCQDVDAIHQSNGCFAAYPGDHVTFQDTRCRDIRCTSQGRGVPSSGGLAWAGSPDSTNLQILASSYHALCAGTVWDRSVFTTVELSDVDFTPRAPQRLAFCWPAP